MSKQLLIPVHVAWNGTNGEVDRLTHVEFTSDCELCSVETDVLDGDSISVSDGVFQIAPTDREMRLGKFEKFEFKSLQQAVGNIMWDMLWMTPEEASRFAVYLQQQRHWTVNCAITEIFESWGSLSAEDFRSHFVEAVQ